MTEHLEEKALSSEGLTPGELTRLLAEKVMGWPVGETLPVPTPSLRGYVVAGGQNSQPAAYYNPFEFWHPFEPLRILDHAWMVIEQLRSRGPAARRAVFESLRPVLLDPVPANPARLVHAVLHLVGVERDGLGVEVAFDEAQRAEDRRRERIDKPAASLLSDLAFHLEDQNREGESWVLRHYDALDDSGRVYFAVLDGGLMTQRLIDVSTVMSLVAPSDYIQRLIAAAYAELRSRAQT